MTGWVWDQRLRGGRGAYRNLANGRILSQADVNKLIDMAIDRTNERITDQLTDMLAAGQLNVADWKTQMARTIKDAYIQQAILAAGGREQMTQRFWGSLSTPLREQYRYLDNFAREIADGKLSTEQIRIRARMYINSSREAYWRIEDMRARTAGLREERWHAVGDDATCGPCREADALGWQPLGTFAQPGSGQVRRRPVSYCKGLTNCRCTKEYR